MIVFDHVKMKYPASKTYALNDINFTIEDGEFVFIVGSSGSGKTTLIKLLLLPVTMGIGYEFIKFAGKHDNAVTRMLSAPGLWMQRITVLEPTDDMIECAIAAVNEVIPEDGSDLI